MVKYQKYSFLIKLVKRMAKKIKSKSKASNLRDLSPESLSQSANSLYVAGDYKNALSRYERLYKDNQSTIIKERLIHCLSERSSELRKKHMYVEAVSLLEHLQNIEPNTVHINDYLGCLINARFYSKAFKICYDRSLDIQTISSEYAVKLAAIAMIEDPSRSNKLITLFANDLLIIQNIFMLLGQDDQHESIASELKKISLRSPFKDLRLLIQSLLLLQNNPTGSIKLALEIQQSSPFFTIAHVIALAAQPPLELYKNITTLSIRQLQLLQQLKGWTARQLDAIVAMAAILCSKQNNVFKQVKFILQLQSSIPIDLLKPVCFSLYDGTPAVWEIITACFGQNEFMRSRMRAIQSEKKFCHKEEYPECLKRWDECIEIIKLSPNLPTEMIGLIKLHQYQFIERNFRTNNVRCVNLLIESLEYLPQRKQTYITICSWYSGMGKKKLHAKWLLKTQKQFADDVSILLDVATLGIHNKTYTKTINTLKKILTIDSINTRAKQLLAYTYFDRAMYEIGRLKETSAASDLAKLKPLQQYLHLTCLVQIGEFFVAYARNSHSSMSEQLALAYQVSRNKLLVNYLVEYYAYILKLNMNNIQSLLTWDLPDSTALTTLTQGLSCICDHLSKHNIKILISIEDNSELKLQITAAIKYCTNKEHFELLCRLFLQLKYYSSLVIVAEAALKRCEKKSALFDYYRIQGKIKGNAQAITNKQYQTLVDWLRNLPEDERSKTRPMITALLDAAERYRRPTFPKGIPKGIIELF